MRVQTMSSKVSDLCVVAIAQIAPVWLDRAPQDLDGMASLLLSDAAGFITGQVIAVDGGWGVRN